MCTVLLRFTPGQRWPVLLGAVRDEFADRPWDPPGQHWPGVAAIGGRDRLAGGTWLAVDPSGGRLAALLNGVILPPPPADWAQRRSTAGGPVPAGRPSRGWLALDAIAGKPLPGTAELSGYDGFHLLVAEPTQAFVYSWDGVTLTTVELAAGDHILVNEGVDAVTDPLVPHFAPLLTAAGTPPLTPTASTLQAWHGWVGLLAGDGIDPTDPRALVVRRELLGRVYGSTSATLVALGTPGVRYDFTANPGPAANWYRVV